jgi:hypothetical protein
VQWRRLVADEDDVIVLPQGKDETSFDLAQVVTATTSYAAGGTTGN